MVETTAQVAAEAVKIKDQQEQAEKKEDTPQDQPTADDVHGDGAEGQAKKKKKKKKNKKKGAAGDDVGDYGAGDQADEEETKDATNQDAGSGDEKEAGEEGAAEGGAKKKKKKKKKSKGGAAGSIAIATAAGAVMGTREQDNSHMRLLGNWKAGEWKQTDPPMIPVSQQFKIGEFPIGEIQEYEADHHRHRITSAEMREKEKLCFEDYDVLRRAAEVHRQTRKHAQKFIKPGMKIMDICNEIEATNRRLIEANGLEAGIAFPTGASINHCAAHWTPNIGDETILGKDDVMKIDYGSHVRGILTDCAFTVAFNPMYDNLLLAVKEATETGIKAAGIDARLGEIGEAIQETMESYEVEIRGKTFKVKCIENLCGHSIGRYNIHAGKSVPIVKRDDNTKMEEGEQYAIETFGSTGKGQVWNDADCSHYMKNFTPPKKQVRNSQAAKLLDVIDREFGTLAFARKWLETHFENHLKPLRMLCDLDIVKSYPPLVDVKGCYTAQYEHTILLRPTCKEVITRGDDF